MNDISFEETVKILDNFTDYFKSYFKEHNLCDIKRDESGRLSCIFYIKFPDQILYQKNLCCWLCENNNKKLSKKNGCKIKCLSCSIYFCYPFNFNRSEYDKIKYKYFIKLKETYINLLDNKEKSSLKPLYAYFSIPNSELAKEIINRNINLKNYLLEKIKNNLSKKNCENKKILKQFLKLVNNG
jgi:hypothetical protein